MDKYNVIVSGDKHHFKMEDVHDKGVWIKTRALAVPGRYEKEQDYQSFAGYLKIKEEETGKPSITIATL